MLLKAPTILLVQTDILIRHPLAEYLRSCGYQVFEAGNADEVKAIALSEQELDVILLDAMNGNGFELAHWLRSQRAFSDVIITGSVKKTVQDAMELCEQGPDPDHTARHKSILAEIQIRLSRRGVKEA